MRNQRVRIPGGLKENMQELLSESLRGKSVYLTGTNRLDDVNKHCLAEFRKHWECLDNNNQQLWQCRKFERPLNKCVFDNLVR
jgi:hypothetical protein